MFRKSLERIGEIVSVEDIDRELMITRVKLEVRTWILRASLAINVSLTVGFLVWLITSL